MQASVHAFGIALPSVLSSSCASPQVELLLSNNHHHRAGSLPEPIRGSFDMSRLTAVCVDVCWWSQQTGAVGGGETELYPFGVYGRLRNQRPVHAPQLKAFITPVADHRLPG
jgi:hypothetical protein